MTKREGRLVCPQRERERETAGNEAKSGMAPATTRFVASGKYSSSFYQPVIFIPGKWKTLALDDGHCSIRRKILTGFSTQLKSDSKYVLLVRGANASQNGKCGRTVA